MPSYFRYIFGIFIWAVALMSGILSILREGLAIFYPDRFPQRSIFGNCVIIAFIISAIILWIIEHKKVINLTTEAKRERDRSKPNLSAEIDFTAVAPAGDKDESSLITIMAIIKNTGAPSIVSNFKLLVKIEDSETIGQFFPLPKDSITLKSTDGQEILLKSADNLLLKSVLQPIVTGGAVTGFCSVLMPNLRQEDVTFKGTMVLSFKDISGNDYAVEHCFTSGKSIKFIDFNKIQKKD